MADFYKLTGYEDALIMGSSSIDHSDEYGWPRPIADADLNLAMAAIIEHLLRSKKG